MDFAIFTTFEWGDPRPLGCWWGFRVGPSRSLIRPDKPDKQTLSFSLLYTHGHTHTQTLCHSHSGIHTHTPKLSVTHTQAHIHTEWRISNVHRAEGGWGSNLTIWVQIISELESFESKQTDVKFISGGLRHRDYLFRSARADATAAEADADVDDDDDAAGKLFFLLLLRHKKNLRKMRKKGEECWQMHLKM